MLIWSCQASPPILHGSTNSCYRDWSCSCSGAQKCQLSRDLRHCHCPTFAWPQCPHSHKAAQVLTCAGVHAHRIESSDSRAWEARATIRNTWGRPAPTDGSNVGGKGAEKETHHRSCGDCYDEHLDRSAKLWFSFLCTHAYMHACMHASVDRLWMPGWVGGGMDACVIWRSMHICYIYMCIYIYIYLCIFIFMLHPPPGVPTHLVC